jgi:phenylacetate-CoA ligase
VPYYRELFRKHRLDPRSIRSAADLQRLPLLDKDVFRTDPLRFVAGRGADDRLFKLRTSGSTGSPVEIYHDVRSLLMNLANVEPEKAVLRQVLSQASINRTKRQMSIAYPGSSARVIRQMYANKLCIRPGRTEPFVSIDTPLDEVVRQINAYEPDVISSYGSYIEMLFRYVAANGIEFRQPEVVLYGADMMTPEGPDLIERQFGVTVLSRYGAVEAFQIVFTCPAKRGFQVRSDMHHIRIVVERWKDIRPDTP